ncbi:MAG: radical SAM protein [Elusimicrobiota bacterium]
MNGQAVDLLIVKPGSGRKQYGAFSSTLSAVEPPLWGIMLAACAREKGFSVRVLDAEAENITPEEAVEIIVSLKPVLCGIIAAGSNLSASTQAMPGAGQLLGLLKSIAPEIKTFIWGLHPSALPERTLEEEKVDFLIQGEGFSEVPELLSRLKSDSGCLKYDISGIWFKEGAQVRSNPRAELEANLDKLPMAAWDLLPMSKYRAHNWHCFDDLDKRSPYAVIYTSLGCPYNCHFCALKALFGKPQVRYRSPESVIAEIDVLVNHYGVRNIKILDECFVLNAAHVGKICELIIARKYDLNIWAYARVDTVNPDLLSKLKQAGVNWLALGIESGSKKVRDSEKQRNYGQEKIFEAINQIHGAGIHVCANFIFGLPEDTNETMAETFEMASELNCEYTNFYVAIAYPGSDLYNEALANNIPLPETWLGYAQFSEDTLPLPTRHISSAEVLAFRDKAFSDYHGSVKYLEMIKDKFGGKTVEHITEMLKLKIKRKYGEKV